MQDNESYQLSLDLPSETAPWSKQVCRAKSTMRRSDDSLDKVRHVQSTRKYQTTAANAMPKRKKALAASLPHPLVITLESSGHSRADTIDSKSTAGRSFDSMPINLHRHAKKVNDSIDSFAKLECTPELKESPLTESSESPLDPTIASSVATNPTCTHSHKSDSLIASPHSVLKSCLQKPSQTTYEMGNLQKSPQSSKGHVSNHSETMNKSPQQVRKQPCQLKSSHSRSSESSHHRSPFPFEIAVTLDEDQSQKHHSETASQASGSKKSCIKNSSCSIGSSTLKRQIEENSDTMGRFVSHERSLKDQLDSLTQRERNCFVILRQHWDTDHRAMPGHMYLRFARFCRFDIRQGRKLLSKFSDRYLSLTAAALEPQLMTRTLFPLPGLKSKAGLDMFYMRPALYFPQLTKTQTIIDNLAYVMLSLVEKEQASVNGIGFLAYMNDWTMDNFCVDYCLQFMKMLQGGVPARVCLFLIVNPPSWFGAIWKLMKPMLHPNFRRKVKMIQESALPKFLAPGYEAFMPCDTVGGTCNTTQLVKDFIAYRKHTEDKTCKRSDL